MDGIAVVIALLDQMRALNVELGVLMDQMREGLAEASQTQRDVWALGRAVQGEGAELFGSQREEVGAWLAHAAVNFHEAGWQPGTLAEQVEQRYHGVRNCDVPALWALRLARQAIEREADVTSGAMFVLSGQDLRVAGMESVKGKAVRSFRHGRHEFYFFKLWPGE